MIVVRDESRGGQGSAPEEKPGPPRSIRGLRLTLLLSYLLLPLSVALYVVTDNSFGYISTALTFFLFILPVMHLISLVYLIVWLRTRRRYRFGGGAWSKAIIILMSAAELITAVLVATVLYQWFTYKPYG